jgi:hypothetical protein
MSNSRLGRRGRAARRHVHPAAGKRSAGPAASFESLESRLLLAVLDRSGDITTDTTWLASDIQRIVGEVRVAPGATLTIQPGTVVKFPQTVADLRVEGTLLADATAQQPIVFTSIFDDTGLDGTLGTADDHDTDGNGPSNGFKGAWDTIVFESGGVGVLDRVQVRFGGINDEGAVSVSGQTTQLTMTDSVIRDSLRNGLLISDADPVLTNVAFINNSNENVRGAIRMDPSSSPQLSGITLTNNGVNGLILDGGALSHDATWATPGVPYRLVGNVTVPAGRTLTLGAGLVIKTHAFNEPGLIVDGELVVEGTASQHVVITSDRDDSAGGDLLNDGSTSGSPGEVGGVKFNPGSTGESDFLEVRYSGDSFNTAIGSSSIYLLSDVVTLRNTFVRDSASRGIRIENADPTIESVTIQNSGGPAVSMDLSSNPTITSPTLINNAINALALDGFGTLTQDAVWDDPDIVYRLGGPLTVPAGRKLTIGAGQVVKAAANASAEIFVDGTLIADGTPAAPIVFTSDRDDSVGGDTNNNGASNGQFFDWQALRFRAGSAGSLLDHIDVRFAGANVPGAITAINATLAITNSLIRGSASHAVAAQTSAQVTLKNNLLIDNTQSGVHAALPSTATNTAAAPTVAPSRSRATSSPITRPRMYRRPAGRRSR